MCHASFTSHNTSRSSTIVILLIIVSLSLSPSCLLSRKSPLPSESYISYLISLPYLMSSSRSWHQQRFFSFFFFSFLAIFYCYCCCVGRLIMTSTQWKTSEINRIEVRRKTTIVRVTEHRNRNRKSVGTLDNTLNVAHIFCLNKKYKFNNYCFKIF